jgi:acetylornithine/succinyldiaminopimelate/putrescine aminotransferase
VAAVFQPGDHGSTYSGTAIAGAAVSAVIAEMRRIDAPSMARRKGEYFAEKLAVIEGVKAVRGQGLLRAAELGPGRDAKAVFGALLERGLVTNAVNATSLRLAPPITTSFEQFDEAASLIADVLAEGVGL